MKKNTMIILIVALLVIGGGAFALVNNKDDKKTNTPAATTQDTTADTPTDTSAGAGMEDVDETETTVIAATITYGNSGFSPSSVTVKAGDTIKVVNSSSRSLDFESDPHPVHTDDPELNTGSIAQGSSKTFKVNSKGTWGYHNHENDSDGGTIIVQ